MLMVLLTEHEHLSCLCVHDPFTFIEYGPLSVCFLSELKLVEWLYSYENSDRINERLHWLRASL